MRVTIICIAASFLCLAAPVLVKAEPHAPAHDHEDAHEHGDHHDHGHEHEDDHEHEHLDKVEVAEKLAGESGIRVDAVVRKRVADDVTLRGTAQLNRDRIAHIKARYAGVVQNVLVNTGDSVKADQTLAVIESNESLRVYEVKTGISGEVLSRHVVEKEFVDVSDELFSIANLDLIWIELQVPFAVRSKIRKGQEATISAPGFESAHGTIDYLSPTIDENVQSNLARVTLPGGAKLIPPGTFVTAQVKIGGEHEALVIKRSAVQMIEDRTSVFVKKGNTYQVTPVVLGQEHGELVEVLSELSEGEPYVSTGSFVLKSELLKGGATHEH